MQRERNSLKRLENKAAKLGGRVTWFPMEQRWSGWVGNKEVTKLHAEKGEALLELLEKLESD